MPLQKKLRVEGHTDETPVGGDRWRNNWDLSAARAATVVSYVEAAHHARPQLLSAVGLGSSHPLTDDDSEAGRTKNRRVELVIEIEPGDDMLGVGLQ